MIQTEHRQAVRCSFENQVKMTLKRKESDDDNDFEEEQHSPKKAYIKPRPEIWQPLSELKEKSRTSGVIPRLEPNFSQQDTISAYLCSPMTDHITTGFMDLGWGCGYRNCQMLMSFLERQKEDGEYLLKHVPDITGLQLLIEQAWKEGFDPLGAEQLKHSVFKTRKWIGTTEVYTLLAYLGIRSTIIDFHQPGPGKLHTKLMDWVQSYFATNINNNNNNNNNSSTNVHITNKPPLYLQHQGHSRTIIGIELLKSGKRNLIMFDPGRRILRSYRMNKRGDGKTLEATDSLKDEEEEDEEEGREELMIENNNIKMSNSSSSSTTASSDSSHRFFSRIKSSFPSALLRPYRVDEKTMGKHKQYQILVLGQVEAQKKEGGSNEPCWNPSLGYMLNEEQREAMKSITSLVL